MVSVPTGPLRHLTGRQLIDALAGSVSPNLESAFCDSFTDGRYVVAGSECPSFGAVEIEPSSISFSEKTRMNKPNQLRCSFSVPGPVIPSTYNFAVTGTEIRDVWSTYGIEALESQRNTAEVAHIRVGLARAFDGDNKCWAMVNNIIYG